MALLVALVLAAGVGGAYLVGGLYGSGVALCIAAGVGFWTLLAWVLSGGGRDV